MIHYVVQLIPALAVKRSSRLAPEPLGMPIICFLSTSLLSEHCEGLQAPLAHLLPQV